MTRKSDPYSSNEEKKIIEIHEHVKGYAPTENQRKIKHSLSLLHTCWLEYKGNQVIAYLDDASRYIVAMGEFDYATTGSTINVLKEAELVAESVNGVIYAIDTSGSRFFANNQGKKERINQFEKYLKRKGIEHISLKKNNSSNGKLKRWFQEYKRHRKRFDTKEGFVTWYNNRVHGALNLEIGETPQEAFIRGLRSESLCGLFWKRMDNMSSLVNLVNRYE